MAKRRRPTIWTGKYTARILDSNGRKDTFSIIKAKPFNKEKLGIYWVPSFSFCCSPDGERGEEEKNTKCTGFVHCAVTSWRALQTTCKASCLAGKMHNLGRSGKLVKELDFSVEIAPCLEQEPCKIGFLHASVFLCTQTRGPQAGKYTLVDIT